MPQVKKMKVSMDEESNMFINMFNRNSISKTIITYGAANNSLTILTSNLEAGFPVSVSQELPIHTPTHHEDLSSDS